MDINDKNSIYQIALDNPKGYSKILKNKHITVHETILKLEGKNFGQKLYNYCYGEKKCECGSNLNFINVVNGYKDVCEPCYKANRKRQPETRPAPICNRECCDNKVTELDYLGKWKLHCSTQCRGIDNSERSRDKAAQTQMEHYGVPHHRQTEESKQHLKDVLMSRHGVSNQAHVKIDTNFKDGNA